MPLGLNLGLWMSGMGGGGAQALPAGALSAGSVPASIEIDFVRDRWLVDGALQVGGAATACTCTRASAAYYRNRAGLLTSVAINILRTGDMGALVEGSRTNVVLQNRDLTNAAWTKSNCTAAKDQTGPDGVTNSASSLTATAGNGTCLQSITLASSARFQSAFVKRLTGSGAIQMTTDNGTTWVEVFPTTNWDQLFIPTQTLANPTVGFRVVTSGDAIAVDFVQNENGDTGPTSPIETAGVAVTRSADLVRPSNTTWLNAAAITVYTAGARGSATAGTAAAFYGISHSTNADSFFARLSPSTAVAYLGRNAASVTQWSANLAYLGTNAVRGRHLTITGAALNDIGMTDEGGSITTDVSATVPVGNRVSIGAQEASSLWNGYIHRFAVWDSKPTNVDLTPLARSGADFIVIGEGDSILRSPSVANFVGFVGRAQYMSPYTYIFDNRCVSGSTVVNAADAVSLSGTRAPILDALRVSYAAANPNKKVVTVVNCGHNDLAGNGHDAAAYTAQLQTYLAARRAAGHIIICCTVPPSNSNVLFNPARNTANATIRGWSGTFWDYLCDWDNTILGPDAAADDTSLYSDGIHPTERGAIILGDYFKSVLDTVPL